MFDVKDQLSVFSATNVSLVQNKNKTEHKNRRNTGRVDMNEGLQ